MIPDSAPKVEVLIPPLLLTRDIALEKLKTRINKNT
jgi:hypothetical protein